MYLEEILADGNIELFKLALRDIDAAGLRLAICAA